MNDEQFENDQTVHDAFDRLRADAGKVNAMTALRNHEDNKAASPWLARPGTLISGLTLAAILIVGGLFLFNGDDSLVESDGPVATEDGAGETTPQPDVDPTPEPESSPTTADPDAAATEVDPAPEEADPIVAETDNDGEGDDGNDTDDSGDVTGSSETTVPEEGPAVVPTGSSFGDLPGCGTLTSDTETASTTATELVEILSFDNGSCRRSVFQFEDGATISADDIPALFPSTGAVEIFYDFTLASDFAEIPENREAGFAGQGIRFDGTPYFIVNHGQPSALTSVAVLNNPARIVVDTPTTRPVSDPLFGTNVILPGAFGEVTLPFTVRGHARPFESFGDVQLRRAPAAGQAPGSGELVDAVWSGTEFLGEVTASSYGYNASFQQWGDFAFTIESLEPGDYELVFVNLAAGEENPDAIALVAPFTMTNRSRTASNEPATATFDGLPENFSAVIDELRTMTSAPILLPTQFPDVEDPNAELFLTIQSAADDRYELTIGFVPDCNGASACRYGTVRLLPQSEGITDVSGVLVDLPNGVSGQFFPATCGAGCNDGSIVWEDDDYSYDVGLKAAMLDDAIDFTSSARIIVE